MADSVNAVKTSHAAYMTSVEKDMLVEIALKYENKIKNKRMNAFSVCQKATPWTIQHSNGVKRRVQSQR